MKTKERTFEDMSKELDKLLLFQQEYMKKVERESKEREKERAEKRAEDEKKRAEEEKREEKRAKERAKERAEEEKKRAEREKKREKKRAEEEKKIAKMDEKSRQSDLKFEKMMNQMQARQKIMDSIKTEVGGTGRSNGAVAENFFYQGFMDNMTVNGTKYDFIEKSKDKRIISLNLQGEYDIVLTNSNKVLVIEVKYNLEKEDIRDFYNKKIPKYKKLFPEYKNYTIYGAMASFSNEDGAEELSRKKGFMFFTQSGEKIKKLTPDDMLLSKF